jgi:hypothetical protein
MFCIEKEPNKIPKVITDVPTIIVKGLSEPLIGIKAIEWIENKKYFDQTTNNIKKNNVLDPHIESALKDLEFNKNENNSISDHYTNFKDGDRLVKKFVDVKNIDNIKIIEENNQQSDIKLTNELQTKKLKEMILLRRSQISMKKIGASKISK